MKTHMECRSLGEDRGNYTNTSVRQIRERETTGEYKTKSKDNSGKLAVGLLAGAAAGALAGLLLAPERGEVTRKKVADSASKLGDQVTKSYSAGREKANSWMSKMNKKNSSASNIHKSPYTNESKWEDQESKNMTYTARNTPGV